MRPTLQVICEKGWVRLGVANVVTAAPRPHPLRTGPGHPVRCGRWAGPSNCESGLEPPAGALFIFIFESFSVKVKVKSAYDQRGLLWTGVKARIHTHFRM